MVNQAEAQRLRDEELNEAMRLENSGSPANRMAVIRWRAICAQSQRHDSAVSLH